MIRMTAALPNAAAFLQLTRSGEKYTGNSRLERFGKYAVKRRTEKPLQDEKILQGLYDVTVRFRMLLLLH